MYVPRLSRITVPVDEETRNALSVLARREMREARFQAGILLREALELRGLLKPSPIGQNSGNNNEGKVND